MKRLLSGIIAACLAMVAVESQAALVITGVIDGPRTGGLPKGIELFALADIADLSIYSVGSANNGQGTDGMEFALSGSTTAGSYITIASELPGWTAYFGAAPTFNGGAAMGINGDDAIELFENGVVIDTFGDITYASAAGLPWLYTDGFAYRNNGTGPDGTAFAIGNWTFSGIDFLDSQGTTGVNGSDGKTVPFGTYQGVTAVPEPSSLAVLGLIGAAGAVVRRRRAAVATAAE